MRLVADPLKEPQRRRVRVHGNRQLAVAHEDELFLLRKPDRNEVGQPDLFQRFVRRIQLTLPTINDDEVREWPALVENLAIATPDDLFHRCKIIKETHGTARKGDCPLFWQLLTRTIRLCHPLFRTYAELAIFAPFHPAVLAHNERRDGLRALDGR